MAFKLAERVRETTTTTGTGTTVQLLGATARMRTFLAGIGDGNDTLFEINSGDLVNWERGRGRVHVGPPATLVIDSIAINSLGTTSPISLVGESVVQCVWPATLQQSLDISPADKEYLRWDAGLAKFVNVSDGYFQQLVVESNGQAVGEIISYKNGLNSTYADFSGRSARGTKASPAYLHSGDPISAHSFYGWDESTSSWKSAGLIQVTAAENWSATARGSRMTFSINQVGSVGDQWRSDYQAEFTLSNSNRTATTNVANHVDTIIGTASHATGTWYVEFQSTIGGDADIAWGIAKLTQSSTGLLGTGSDGLALRRQPGPCHWRVGGVETNSGMPKPSNGDLIGMLFDLDNGLAFVRNITVAPTVWYGDGVGPVNADTRTHGFAFTPFAAEMFLAFTSNSNLLTQAVIMNSGNAAFGAAVPSGASAWNDNAHALSSLVLWEDGGASFGSDPSMGFGTLNTKGLYVDASPVVTAASIGSSLPVIGSAHLLGNPTAGAIGAEDTSLDALLDRRFGTTRGTLIYRGSSLWAARNPGTSGYALLSNGPGADPDYGAVASALAGLSDVALASLASNDFLAYNSATSKFTNRTHTAATALLDVMIGDTGSGGTKGLVPAPASGDAAAGRYLKADGTYAVPPGVAGSAITALTGDVTANGPGSVPGTVGSIGGKAVTLAGSLTTSGAFGLTFIVTATTSVTLPAGAHSLAPLNSPAFTGTMSTEGTQASTNSIVVDSNVLNLSISGDNRAAILRVSTGSPATSHVYQIFLNNAGSFVNPLNLLSNGNVGFNGMTNPVSMLSNTNNSITDQGSVGPISGAITWQGNQSPGYAVVFDQLMNTTTGHGLLVRTAYGDQPSRIATFNSNSTDRVVLFGNGHFVIGANIDSGGGQVLQVTGTGSISGAMTAPTASNGTNTTQLATTAFVQSALGLHTLAGDTDAAITSPADDDILVYISSTSKWTNKRPKYVIAASMSGVLTASQQILYHRFAKAVTIPANFGAYLGLASQAGGTANATASTVINVDKAVTATPNTFSNVGTITIAAAGVTPTFASSGGAAISFAQGDVLRIVGPSTADATFAGFYATLAGYET